MGNTLIFHINVLSLYTQKNPLINPAGHQEHATLVYIFNFRLELLESLSRSCNHFFQFSKQYICKTIHNMFDRKYSLNHDL